MIYKNAKEYLSSYKYLNIDITKLRLSIKELEEAITTVSGMSFDDVRVQSSCNKDKMSNQIIALLEKRDKYTKMIQEKTKLKEKLIKEIESLPNIDESKVLEFKYIFGLSYDEIGESIFCTSRWARELVRRGLVNFEKCVMKRC